jgi:hypothetical protein
MAGIRERRTLGSRGGDTQGDAECEYPAKQISQMFGHVVLFPAGWGWIGQIFSFRTSSSYRIIPMKS